MTKIHWFQHVKFQDLLFFPCLYSWYCNRWCCDFWDKTGNLNMSTCTMNNCNGHFFSFTIFCICVMTWNMLFSLLSLGDVESITTICAMDTFGLSVWTTSGHYENMICILHWYRFFCEKHAFCFVSPLIQECSVCGSNYFSFGTWTLIAVMQVVILCVM